MTWATSASRARRGQQVDPAGVPRQRALEQDPVQPGGVLAEVGQGVGRLQVEQGGQVARLELQVHQQATSLCSLARTVATLAASVLDPLPPLGASTAISPPRLLLRGHARPGSAAEGGA